MGMSINSSAAMSSTNTVNQYRHNQQGMQQLMQQLSSNNLAGAQQAYANLTANMTTQPSANSPLGQIGAALSNSDLSTAQGVAANWQQSRQAGRHSGANNSASSQTASTTNATTASAASSTSSSASNATTNNKNSGSHHHHHHHGGGSGSTGTSSSSSTGTASATSAVTGTGGTVNVQA